MTEDNLENKEVVEPKLLFCKRCRGLKVDNREYCSYCVGRHEIKNSSFRVRMAYRFLPSSWKSWFAFYLGYQRKYMQLLPEHLRKTEWLDIEQMNEPIEADEE